MNLMNMEYPFLIKNVINDFHYIKDLKKRLEWFEKWYFEKKIFMYTSISF